VCPPGDPSSPEEAVRIDAASPRPAGVDGEDCAATGARLKGGWVWAIACASSCAFYLAASDGLKGHVTFLRGMAAKVIERAS
jgi:hypothetical protein